MGNIAVSEYIGKRFGHLTVIGEAPKTHEYSNRFCSNVIAEKSSKNSRPELSMGTRKLAGGVAQYAKVFKETM